MANPEFHPCLIAKNVDKVPLGAILKMVAVAKGITDIRMYDKFIYEMCATHNLSVLTTHRLVQFGLKNFVITPTRND